MDTDRTGGDEMRKGTRVRHKATGALGTITAVNTERKPSISGKVADLWVKWDARDATFGANRSEIESV